MSCFYPRYNCLPCSKGIDRINIQNFLWSPDTEGPGKIHNYFYRGIGSQYQVIDPVGKLGYFWFAMFSWLHTCIFLVLWRRFGRVQLVGKKWLCFLICHLELSWTSPLGQVRRSLRFLQLGLDWFSFRFRPAIAASLRKLQFIFWLSRKSLLKYWYPKHKHWLPTQGKEAASHPGARKQASLNLCRCLFSHVIFSSRSGDWHRNCPRGFRCGPLNYHQYSSSQES